MTFILFLSSAVVGLWVLLNFTPCSTGKNSFFDYSILNYFKILSRYVLIEKIYQASWSISIDLDAQYVSSFTEVFLLKNSFQILLYAFQKSLHYFWSTICQQHILIRNSIVLPLTSLEIQVSHKLCTNPKFLIIIKAYIPTPRCSLQSLEGLLELCILISILRDWQNLPVVSHTTFPQENRRGNNVLTSYLQDFINNAVIANIIPTDS